MIGALRPNKVCDMAKQHNHHDDDREPHPWEHLEWILQLLYWVRPGCPNWNEAAKEMKKALILAAKSLLIGRTFSDVTELAKDVSQEWWMLAHARLFKRYRPEEPLFPFPYEALRRLCLPNSRKKNGKDLPGLFYEPLDHRCNPIRDERQHDLRRRIGHALWELPKKERQAIVLRFYKNASFVDVAKRQGCTTTALYLRLHHGMEKLKMLLADFAEYFRRKRRKVLRLLSN